MMAILNTILILPGKVTQKHNDGHFEYYLESAEENHRENTLMAILKISDVFSLPGTHQGQNLQLSRDTSLRTAENEDGTWALSS